VVFSRPGGQADYVLVGHDAAVGENQACPGFAFAQLADYFYDRLGMVRISVGT
jgi:hypothetical protein